MSKILLYGNLADKYGKEFEASVYSVADALSCMFANFRGFKHDLLANEQYSIFIDNKDIGTEEIGLAVSGKDIKIVPIIEGASGGAKMIAGAALAALTFIPTAGASAALVPGLVTTLGGNIAGALFNIGIGMLFSGFAELLFSPPEEDVDDEKSYLFNGAQNITTQGGPVQVGYGRLLVGSTTISTEHENKNAFKTSSNSIYGG